MPVASLKQIMEAIEEKSQFDDKYYHWDECWDMVDDDEEDED